jgi:hypothetical protein
MAVLSIVVLIYWVFELLVLVLEYLVLSVGVSVSVNYLVLSVSVECVGIVLGI